jgi:hypothetical protein
MQKGIRRLVGTLLIGAAVVAASTAVRAAARRITKDVAVPEAPAPRPVGKAPKTATTAGRQPEAEEHHQFQFGTLQATRAQAKATYLGAAFAAIALIISMVTWVGQWRLNEQQVHLNERAEERDEQVYASRVSDWYVDGPDATSLVPAGLDVSIQNRAPVPVDDVRLIAPIFNDRTPRAFGEMLIGLIPPCKIVEVRVVAPQGMRFARSATAAQARIGLKIAFTETDRSWYLDGSRLKLLDAEDLGAIPVSGSLPKLLGFRYTLSPLSDCSEGY